MKTINSESHEHLKDFNVIQNVLWMETTNSKSYGNLNQVIGENMELNNSKTYDIRNEIA